jgi:hypothetical protein
MAKRHWPCPRFLTSPAQRNVGVLSSAEVVESCGARAAEDGRVARAAGQGGQGLLSAEADDGHELAAKGGIDLAHDIEVD